MAEVVFVDSSVLLNVLDVPGKNSDRERLTAEFKAVMSAGATFVIPIAAVVEVGNHIAQLPGGGQRRDRALRLVEPAGFDGWARPLGRLRRHLGRDVYAPARGWSPHASWTHGLVCQQRRKWGCVDLARARPLPRSQRSPRRFAGSAVDAGLKARGLHMTPPPYPRIPYLWAPPGLARADRVVPAGDVAGWLQRPVIVEEKLDGANVTVWLDGGHIQVASRGGAGAMDRGGQLGRLRAWAGEREDQVRQLVADGSALYGEWLWVTHGTAYDALPDWLIVLDCWHSAAGFASVDDRDRRATAAGLVVPPRRFEGVLGGEAALRSLFGPSSYRLSGRSEGLVLRAADGRRCKIVDPLSGRRTEQDWDGRRHNALADTRAAAGGG